VPAQGYLVDRQGCIVWDVKPDIVVILLAMFFSVKMSDAAMKGHISDVTSNAIAEFFKP
jgi:hypothetical protein